MLRSLASIFLIALVPAVVTAIPSKPVNKIKHVIYITLDGTRWQDIYIDKRLPIFLEKYAELGTWYGKPGDNTRMEVASIPISLPSYQSQMSGYVQPCISNSCGRIEVQTMPERLVREYNFTKSEVATFSSWQVLGDAVESVAGTTYTNIGNVPAYDPITNMADPEMQRINNLQSLDQPKDGDRYDKYTFALALHYFQKYQPHFLWISLIEADDAAHAEDLEAYHQAFVQYDQFLDELFTMLKTMNLNNDTMVIVTTDHGRGNGKNWTSHGPMLPASKRTWAFVYNGELKPMRQDGMIMRYNTTSIRPTIEGALLK